MKTLFRDFSGGLVVRNLSCNAEDEGLIAGQGTKTPHATWHDQKVNKIKYFLNVLSLFFFFLQILLGQITFRVLMLILFNPIGSVVVQSFSHV